MPSARIALAALLAALTFTAHAQTAGGGDTDPPNNHLWGVF
jgi:hypothetical protein